MRKLLRFEIDVERFRFQGLDVSPNAVIVTTSRIPIVMLMVARGLSTGELPS